jgi:hypothetical protein
MFRTISIIAFIITVAGIVFYSLFSKQKQPAAASRQLTFLCILKKLAYLLALLCFVILAITGFYQPLVLEKHITGFILMAHATFAPVFAVCFVFLVLCFAHRYSFGKADSHLSDNKVLHCNCGLGLKITFWLMAAMALPVFLSAVLSMFSFFGTSGQEFLLNLHRYSALLFALVAIINTYTVIRLRY